MDTALVLPATCSIVEEEEMTYLDGGGLILPIVTTVTSIATTIVTSLVSFAFELCGFVGTIISGLVNLIAKFPLVNIAIGVAAVAGFGYLGYSAINSQAGSLT